MDPLLITVIVIVAVALIFDVINGFHDALDNAVKWCTKVLSKALIRNRHFM